jgi:hypothetical protein
VSHGSVLQPHLIRSDIGYTHETAGVNSGTCSNGCHADMAYAGP